MNIFKKAQKAGNTVAAAKRHSRWPVTDYHNTPRTEPVRVNVKACQDEGALAFHQNLTLAANPYNDIADATRWSYWRDGWFRERDESDSNVVLAAHLYLLAF